MRVFCLLLRFFFLLVLTPLLAFAEDAASYTSPIANTSSPSLEEELLSPPPPAKKARSKKQQRISQEALPSYTVEALPPTPISDLTFLDEFGQRHSFEEYYGKVLLLNFWATWSTPSITEIADLSALQKDFKRKNFKVMAISEDFKGPEAVRSFYETNNIKNLDIFMDHKNALFRAFSIASLPTSFIIDSENNAVIKVTGTANWNDDHLRQFILSYIQRAELAPSIPLPHPAIQKPVIPPSPAPALPDIQPKTEGPLMTPSPSSIGGNSKPAAQKPSTAKSPDDLIPSAAITHIPTASTAKSSSPPPKEEAPSSLRQGTRRPLNQPPQWEPSAP